MLVVAHKLGLQKKNPWSWEDFTAPFLITEKRVIGWIGAVLRELTFTRSLLSTCMGLVYGFVPTVFLWVPQSLLLTSNGAFLKPSTCAPLMMMDVIVMHYFSVERCIFIYLWNLHFQHFLSVTYIFSWVGEGVACPRAQRWTHCFPVWPPYPSPSDVFKNYTYFFLVPFCSPNQSSCLNLEYHSVFSLTLDLVRRMKMI